ncbi:hypothetical protein B7R54_12180 [Subtercola boreus]|uniref:Htaa domain-containing protein n=1 Tax=Subtercola boreus TaxID=120213 RepID=A0A3E0VJR6_9MICO|nr:hypothetical protein [Subtercola boreus]RFA09875.1 hypothetical protein B7R54_12180 [Subtercola boreus]TQL52995.1 hypothetical protein FB464_0486 [Subtercola boreus]
MRNFKKVSIAIAASGLLAFSLAACSTSSTTSSSPSASASASTNGTPIATIPTLSGKDTAVTVDAGFLAALTSLGLTPGVLGTATLSTAGVLDFPITGGNVKYYDPNESYRPYVQGSIEHEGSGLSLTGGGIEVDLTNFTIDPGTSKLYGDVAANGAEVAKQAFLFDLDGSTLKPLQTSGDTAILEGTTVHVSADAAALLNKTYGTTAVKEGLLVGVAKITVNTK